MNLFGLTVTVIRTRHVRETEASAVIFEEQAADLAQELVLARLRDSKSALAQAIGRCARAEAKDWIEEHGEEWLKGLAR